MRLLLLFPLILHLHCLPVLGAALDSGGTNVGSEFDQELQVGNLTDTPKASSWTSFLSPSHIIGKIQSISLSSVFQWTDANQTSGTPAEFWDKAKELEHTLQEYVPRLLESAAEYYKLAAFTDVTSTMVNIVRVTATFRESIQGVLETQNVTLEMLSEEFEGIFLQIVDGMEEAPPPDKVSGHAKRTEMLDGILDNTQLALVNLATPLGIQEEPIATYMDDLRPHVHTLVSAVDTINRKFPGLLSAIAFCVVTLLIPESWILRPLLSLFGFGPLGPLKGSAAAWLQRYFWGGAVPTGSWFALLQAAGTGKFPQWAEMVTKAPLVIGALVAMLIPCLRRGQ